MGRQISMATRQELVGAIAARYTAGSREESAASRTKRARHSVPPEAMSVSVRVWTELPDAIPPQWGTRSAST